jgi:hypothetical protein
MPEHEIVKHTEAIYKAWKDPSHNWKHKLVEISIEIGIIVFAITLSLFLERWRERVHEREIERQFLVGLKSDLINDIQQQSGDSTSYANIIHSWVYLRKAGMEKRFLPPDTLNLLLPSLTNTTGFIPNDSRFQGLKSSGQLGVIENVELQNKILELYQLKIRTLIVATDEFSSLQRNHIAPFLAERLVLQSNGKQNLNEILQIPQMQNFLIYSALSSVIISRYHDVMAESREIILLIDRQYDGST